MDESRAGGGSQGWSRRAHRVVPCERTEELLEVRLGPVPIGVLSQAQVDLPGEGRGARIPTPVHVPRAGREPLHELTERLLPVQVASQLVANL
jgi:hypothetical protein